MNPDDEDDQSIISISSNDNANYTTIFDQLLNFKNIEHDHSSNNLIFNQDLENKLENNNMFLDPHNKSLPHITPVKTPILGPWKFVNQMSQFYSSDIIKGYNNDIYPQPTLPFTSIYLNMADNINMAPKTSSLKFNILPINQCQSPNVQLPSTNKLVFHPLENQTSSSISLPMDSTSIPSRKNIPHPKLIFGSPLNSFSKFKCNNASSNEEINELNIKYSQLLNQNANNLFNQTLNQKNKINLPVKSQGTSKSHNILFTLFPLLSNQSSRLISSLDKSNLETKSNQSVPKTYGKKINLSDIFI